MGISGLLPLLKEAQVKRNISEFKGKSLAIDGYVWLHKGAFGCAEDLMTGKKTTKFVDYAMHRVRLLKHHGISPLLVFDGGPLPAKKGTEVDRAGKRQANLAKAKALTAQGRYREARECYTKCVDITPEMALQLIKALKAESIPYIVAPYEADAQLAYLEREGIVDGIITEDSDLLVFGCKNVIYKLEGDGECIHIDRGDFIRCREFSFAGWGDTEFRRMAVLAGCDYLDSIPGIGIKTAHRLLRKHKSVEKVVQNLRLDGSLPVPADYIPQFRLAELVFLHQRVYDPRTERLDNLLPVPEGGLGEVEEKYVGHDMEGDIAKGIAEGRLHPESKEELEDLWPEYDPENLNVGMDLLPDMGGLSKAKSKGGATLMGSKKVNVSVASGPLDAFIKRLPPKASSSKKPYVPPPVGTRKSGGARLSDVSTSADHIAKKAEKKAKENVLVPTDDEDEEVVAVGTSKFFGGAKRRPSGRINKEESGGSFPYEIVHEKKDSGGESPAEAGSGEDKAPEPPSDDLPAVSSPPPTCSSFASPMKASQAGSHFSSPGEPEKQEDMVKEGAVSSSPNEESLTGRTKKRRQLLPPSPLEQAPKRRRTVTPPPRAQSVLAIASSPPQIRSPSQASRRSINLRKMCGIDEDEPDSSIQEDWDDDKVKHQKQEDDRDGELPSSDGSEENARAIAQSLRNKYAFTPKITPIGRKGNLYRTHTTPVPAPRSNPSTLHMSRQTKSFDRVAPTESPSLHAFANVAAGFGLTPRPGNGARKRSESVVPRTMDKMKPVQAMSFGMMNNSRAEPEEEMDDIEVEDDDDDTPMKRPSGTRQTSGGDDVGGSMGMSGSQRLLAFRYHG